MKTPPISVSMTPAFYDPEHMLLRAQLRCLMHQTVKDFDVWLFDPHYQKRKDVIPEIAERMKLDIKHVPYAPATHVAKIYDCAIFNSGYCYSQAPTNVRYSCYRFVRPAFIEAIASAPRHANVDFHMLAVGPCIYEELEKRPIDRHWNVFNFESEHVNWGAIPTKTGYGLDYKPNGDRSLGLAHWGPRSDENTDVVPIPGSVFGNIAWRRDQWLAINGTSEVVTNSHHWEDLDFDARALMAGQVLVRRTHLMYRLHHTYGGHSQRSNVEVDVPFKKPCVGCWSVLRQNKDQFDQAERQQARIDAGEYNVYEDKASLVCKTCGLSGGLFGKNGLSSYAERVRKQRLIRAAILPNERIGRNLNRVAEAIDRCTTLQSKVETFSDSWTNPAYYES